MGDSPFHNYELILIAQASCEIRLPVKWKQYPSPAPLCSKPTCPSEPDSQFSPPRPSDPCSLWSSHLTWHTPSPGTHLRLALGQLSYGPCFCLTFHVTVYIVSLIQGSSNRGLYQNYLGKCFQTTNVRMALLLLTLSRRHK